MILLRQLLEELPDQRALRADVGVLAAWMGDSVRAREVDSWLEALDDPYKGRDDS